MVGDIDLQKVIAPAPNGKRGYGTHLGWINTGKMPGRIAYGNQTNVWVREVADPLNVFNYRKHNAQVNCVRWAHTAIKDRAGGWIASGDEHGNYKVWTCRAVEPVTKLEGISGKCVKDIAWAGDCKKVYVVGDGKEEKGKAADWSSGNQYGIFRGSTKCLLSVDGRPKRPFAAMTTSEDYRCCFYSKSPMKQQSTNQGVHHKFVNCVRYSPNGDHMLTVSSDKTIGVFDGRSGENVNVIKSDHSGSIYSVAWSPDSTRFATASADKTVKIFDFESASCMATIPIGSGLLEDALSSVVWVDSTVIAQSICGDLHYINGDGPDGVDVTLVGHQTPVMQMVVAYGSENGDVWTMSSTKIIHTSIYDGGSRRYRNTPHGRNVAFVQLGLSCDNSAIITVGQDDHLIRTPVDDIELCPEKIAIGEGKSGSAMWLVTHTTNPDISYVCASRTGIRVVNGITPIQDIAINAYDSTRSACMTRDGSRLIVACRDNSTNTSFLLVYPVQDDGTLGEPEEKRTAILRPAITRMKVCPNGEFVAIVMDKKMLVFNLDSFDAPTQQQNISYHAADITDIDWHEDGRGFMTSGSDRSIIEFDDIVEANTHHENPSLDVSSVTCVNYLNHEVIVSAGSSGAIKMFLRG